MPTWAIDSRGGDVAEDRCATETGWNGGGDVAEDRCATAILGAGDSGLVPTARVAVWTTGSSAGGGDVADDWCDTVILGGGGGGDVPEDWVLVETRCGGDVPEDWVLVGIRCGGEVAEDRCATRISAGEVADVRIAGSRLVEVPIDTSGCVRTGDVPEETTRGAGGGEMLIGDEPVVTMGAAAAVAVAVDAVAGGGDDCEIATADVPRATVRGGDVADPVVRTRVGDVETAADATRGLVGVSVPRVVVACGPRCASLPVVTSCGAGAGGGVSRTGDVDVSVVCTGFAVGCSCFGGDCGGGDVDVAHSAVVESRVPARAGSVPVVATRTGDVDVSADRGRSVALAVLAVRTAVVAIDASEVRVSAWEPVLTRGLTAVMVPAAETRGEPQSAWVVRVATRG
jgi:hypothetical protein